jgi:hypothetical protein
VGVPEEAAAGKARVTVSFAEWRDGHVAPATFEVEVAKPAQSK